MSISKGFLGGVALGALGVWAALGVAPGRAHGDAAPMPFSIDIQAPPAQKGKPATAKVKIIAAPTHHMNKEYPTSLTLTPPAGIAVAKAKLAGADAKVEEKAAEFVVTFTPSEAGTKEIAGDLKFAVCTAESCIPQKIKIGIQTTTK